MRKRIEGAGIPHLTLRFRQLLQPLDLPPRPTMRLGQVASANALLVIKNKARRRRSRRLGLNSMVDPLPVSHVLNSKLIFISY